MQNCVRFKQCNWFITVSDSSCANFLHPPPPSLPQLSLSLSLRLFVCLFSPFPMYFLFQVLFCSSSSKCVEGLVSLAFNKYLGKIHHKMLKGFCKHFMSTKDVFCFTAALSLFAKLKRDEGTLKRKGASPSSAFASVYLISHISPWAICTGQFGIRLEMHIDTKSRIDIIAIFLFCIDIFNQYIGICKSFHQVINFGAQSQKCECLHSHTMQRERERDVYDFLVNPWNKNVYFVRMSARYKTQKGGNQSHALDHHVFWTAAAQLSDKT